MKKYLLLALLISIEASAQETCWTYYNTWCMGDSSQWSLNGTPWYMPTRKFFANRGNLTHIMIFPGNDIIKGDHPPYLSCTAEYAANGGGVSDSINVLWNGQGNPGGGSISAWTARGAVPELIDSCHGRGIKVLLTLNAVTPSTGWDAITTDTAKAHVFAYAVARYVNTHNFDGVDINVENNPVASQAQTATTFRILRQYLGSGKLITVVPPPTKWGWYNAECISYIDYCLPQHYVYGSNWQPSCPGGGANGNFLKVPLHKDPQPPGANHQDITTWGVNQFYSAGWPKNKLIILLSNEGLLFKNVDTMFSCSGWTSYWVSDTLAKYMLTNGGTYFYDSIHVGAYIAGTTINAITIPRGASLSAGQKFYIATLDPKNIDSVLAWGRNQGYSGFGLYDVSTDVSMRKQSPMVIHDYLSSKLNTGLTLPIVPTGSITATPQTLPVGGGAVTLIWTSQNADSAFINEGIGEVPVNGSTIITVTISTRFTITLFNAGTSNSYSTDVSILLPTQYNLALNKPCTASSFDLTGNEAEKANDGSLVTRWSSSYDDNQWWQVDLEEASSVGRVTLTWENAYASQFKISTSLDGYNFTDAATASVSGPTTSEINFSPVNARYVRLIGIERGTPWGISFFELAVYEQTTSVAPAPGNPKKFSLLQNYPNPFNPTTTINYQLSVKSAVRLTVYNMLGKEIKTLVDRVQPAGQYTATFNAQNIASGMYYARLQAEGKVQGIKMILMK